MNLLILNGPNQPGGTLDRGVHVLVSFLYICSRSSFSILTSKLFSKEEKKKEHQTFFYFNPTTSPPLPNPHNHNYITNKTDFYFYTLSLQLKRTSHTLNFSDIRFLSYFGSQYKIREKTYPGPRLR